MRYRVALKSYRLSFRQPLRTAHGHWAEREGVWVRLEDEGGRIGFGEAAPVVGFGADTQSSVAEELRRLGEFATEEQLAELSGAGGCVGFAVSSALRELAGATHEAQADYLSVAALLPAGVGCLRAVEARAELGFRVFKWKVGVGNPADERVLLDDLLAELPEGSRLRLDANGAWDRREAERWLKVCADRESIDYVEQPVSPQLRGAEDLLMGLASEYPTTLALDESVVGETDLERWVGMGWPGVFVIKPTLWGDPRRLISMVKKDALDVVISTALETTIGAKSVLRVAFELGEKARPLGTGVWPLFHEAWANGPTAMPFVRLSDLDNLNTAAAWEGRA
jgi:O-succinylbenzoate synthase